MAEPDGSQAGLLLEGIVLRLQADLRGWKRASAPGLIGELGEREQSDATIVPPGGCVRGTGTVGLVRAVDNVDLEVDQGEALAIMGRRGCGKSTLLHRIGGLDRPSAGEIWLERPGSTGCLSAALPISGAMT